MKNPEHLYDGISKLFKTCCHPLPVINRLSQGCILTHADRLHEDKHVIK